MSENDPIQKSLPPTEPVLKSGEEPTELLLQLVWSPLETLAKRDLAKVFVGKEGIMIYLPLATYDPGAGLVPTVPKGDLGEQKNEPKPA